MSHFTESCLGSFCRNFDIILWVYDSFSSCPPVFSPFCSFSYLLMWEILVVSIFIVSSFLYLHWYNCYGIVHLCSNICAINSFTLFHSNNSHLVFYWKLKQNNIIYCIYGVISCFRDQISLFLTIPAFKGEDARYTTSRSPINPRTLMFIESQHTLQTSLNNSSPIAPLFCNPHLLLN